MKRENDLDKGIQMYLREIRKSLYCKSSTKKNFLERLEDSIDDYLEDHPNANMEDIIFAFGSPQEIAKEFALENDVSYIKEHLFKKRALVIVAAVIILAALSVIICASIISINSNKNTNGHYEVIVTEDKTTSE